MMGRRIADQEEIKKPILIGNNEISKCTTKGDVGGANKEGQLVPVLHRRMLRFKGIEGFQVELGRARRAITERFQPPKSGRHSHVVEEDSSLVQDFLLQCSIGATTDVGLFAAEFWRLT